MLASSFGECWRKVTINFRHFGLDVSPEKCRYNYFQELFLDKVRPNVLVTELSCPRTNCVSSKSVASEKQPFI